uniref:Uncharacterized protein n=1 Tax=Trichuris muris TaxID=70415 RepID=A0A5S6QA51_TRIMR
MTYSIRMPKRGDTWFTPVRFQATTLTTDDATKTLNLTALYAEQRPQTVGKVVAPKPGLNTASSDQLRRLPSARWDKRVG